MSDTYHAGEGFAFAAEHPDLCRCTSTNESAAAAPIPTTDLCCCKVPTEREKAAAKLRDMMQDASPRDKCELCKAAELLEKKYGGGVDMMWLFLLLLMMPTIGGCANIDPAMLRAMADAMEKESDKGGK